MTHQDSVWTGDWLVSRRTKGETGIAVGPYQPRTQIDFSKVLWERPKTYYQILITGPTPAIWDPHSVLSDWKVIRSIKPSRKTPPWLTTGLELTYDENLVRVAEIRGSWVLIERPRDKEKVIAYEDGFEALFTNFIGIYRISEILSYFSPKLSRLQRAAFLDSV